MSEGPEECERIRRMKRVVLSRCAVAVRDRPRSVVAGSRRVQGRRRNGGDAIGRGKNALSGPVVIRLDDRFHRVVPPDAVEGVSRSCIRVVNLRVGAVGG